MATIASVLSKIDHVIAALEAARSGQHTLSAADQAALDAAETKLDAALVPPVEVAKQIP